jgi:hypothetical protein
MSAKMIVVLADQDDAKRGEITVVDNPRTAAHLVETFLEAGLERERISVLSGQQAEMRVGYRPVVALVDDPSATVTGDPPADEEVEPEEARRRANEKEAVPIRFSSLFRAAYP